MRATLETAQRMVVELARAVESIPDPRDSNAMLSGLLITSLVGHISDERWRQMMAVREAPCDVPDCMCHHRTARMLELLDDQREFYQRVMAAERAGDEMPKF